jgi:hypothetical protein
MLINKKNIMKNTVLFFLLFSLVSCSENLLIEEHLLFEKTWTFDATRSVNVQKITELKSLRFLQCTPSSKQAKTGKYSCGAQVLGPQSGLVLNYNLTNAKELNVSFLQNENLKNDGALNQQSKFQTDLFLTLRDKWSCQISDKEMIWKQGDKILYFNSN